MRARAYVCLCVGLFARVCVCILVVYRRSCDHVTRAHSHTGRNAPVNLRNTFESNTPVSFTFGLFVSFFCFGCVCVWVCWSPLRLQHGNNGWDECVRGRLVFFVLLRGARVRSVLCDQTSVLVDQRVRVCECMCDARVCMCGCVSVWVGACAVFGVHCVRQTVPDCQSRDERS